MSDQSVSVLYLQPGYPGGVLQVARHEILAEVRKKLPSNIKDEAVFLKLKEEGGFVKGMEMVLRGEEGTMTVSKCSPGDILIEREQDCICKTPKCLFCGEYTKVFGALVAEWKKVNVVHNKVSVQGKGTSFCWSWRIDKLREDVNISAEEGLVLVPKTYRCVKEGCLNKRRLVNKEGQSVVSVLK